MGQSSTCMTSTCKIDLEKCEKQFVEQHKLDLSSLCEVNPIAPPNRPRYPAEDDEVIGPLEGNGEVRRLGAEADEGVTQLDRWLSSEVGDEKLTRTADLILIKAMQRGSKEALDELKLTKNGGMLNYGNLLHGSSSASSSSRFYSRGREPELEVPQHFTQPFPSSWASESLEDQPDLLPPEVYAEAFESRRLPGAMKGEVSAEAGLNSDRAKKRSVRFEEAAPATPQAAPAEKQSQILWSLLPEPEPTTFDRRKLPRIQKQRRRAEDTNSETSEDSSASRSSKGSRTDSVLGRLKLV